MLSFDVSEARNIRLGLCARHGTEPVYYIQSVRLHAWHDDLDWPTGMPRATDEAKGTWLTKVARCPVCSAEERIRVMERGLQERLHAVISRRIDSIERAAPVVQTEVVPATTMEAFRQAIAEAKAEAMADPRGPVDLPPAPPPAPPRHPDIHDEVPPRFRSPVEVHVDQGEKALAIVSGANTPLAYLHQIAYFQGPDVDPDDLGAARYMASAINLYPALLDQLASCRTVLSETHARIAARGETGSDLLAQWIEQEIQAIDDLLELRQPPAEPIEDDDEEEGAFDE